MKLTTWTGSRAALDEIAPDHLQRIEVENHADALHQPLERKIHLRPAEPGDEPARGLVGEHDTVADRQMPRSTRPARCGYHL